MIVDGSKRISVSVSRMTITSSLKLLTQTAGAKRCRERQNLCVVWWAHVENRSVAYVDS